MFVIISQLSEMEEIEVPSDFLCPISKQLMRDPVTISTGITYDRDSIETWLFSYKNTNCPITKQAVSREADLIPNHALRRIIQSWCTLNASHGIERIPTPKPPIDKAQIMKLIANAKGSPKMQTKCLQQLRSIVHRSGRNRVCLENVGAIEFLASIIEKNDSNTIEVAADNGPEFKKASDEALWLLHNLDISETYLKKLVNNDATFTKSLMNVLKSGSLESRAYTTMLMKRLFKVADPNVLVSNKQGLFNEIVRILCDKISQQATKAALSLLVELCQFGLNRIKAVQAGTVSVLIELLLESSERRVCEFTMVVLDQLCGCAEGRTELLSHGAGLAVVSKKILRVSPLVTDRAVRVLSSISRFSASSRVLEDMLQVRVVTKLCLVLQVGTSAKTKERANQILKLHSRVWRNSSCVPPHVFSSYTSPSE